MTRDQRLFMVAAGEATRWDSLRTNLESALSRQTRNRRESYAALHGMFRAALADPDDRVTLRIERRRPQPKVVAASVLLGFLSIVIFFEWGTYTLPAIYQYIGVLAHRCGLK